MIGLCRLCASLKKPELVTNNNDQLNDICRKLSECFHINALVEDGLPKSVCLDCIENVNIAYRFYIKVQEAQESLRAWFPLPSAVETDTGTRSSSLDNGAQITDVIADVWNKKHLMKGTEDPEADMDTIGNFMRKETGFSVEDIQNQGSVNCKADWNVMDMNNLDNAAINNEDKINRNDLNIIKLHINDAKTSILKEMQTLTETAQALLKRLLVEDEEEIDQLSTENIKCSVVLPRTPLRTIVEFLNFEKILKFLKK